MQSRCIFSQLINLSKKNCPKMRRICSPVKIRTCHTMQSVFFFWFWKSFYWEKKMFSWAPCVPLPNVTSLPCVCWDSGSVDIVVAYSLLLCSLCLCVCVCGGGVNLCWGLIRPPQTVSMTWNRSIKVFV